jgi:8-oxo-dGTP pyrophosphatase MutT (NUDIX family)
MPISQYYKSLRDKLGHDLLMIPVVAAVIHNDDGEVLMLRHRADNKWSLPAGAIEPSESPEDAIEREVAEETGLDIQPTKILGVVGGDRYRLTYPNGDEVEYTVTVYAADRTSGNLHAADGEALEFGWFDPLSPPDMGMSYPRDVLLKIALGPPPNFARIAEAYDLPDDAESWSPIPFGIASVCALRFRGHRYGKELRPPHVDIVDHYSRTGELSGELLDRWTAFFKLQRGLGKWGMERSHPVGRYYRAFYALFLNLYDSDIPPDYVHVDYDRRWQNHYVPRLDQCVSYIRHICEAMP